jgi:hypothetical protein
LGGNVAEETDGKRCAMGGAMAEQKKGPSGETPGEKSSDTVGKASQAANWFVGLSGAAVGGALAKLDFVERFPRSAKVFFVLAAGAFLVSTVSGIFYYFQLLAAGQAKERVDREEARNPLNHEALEKAKTERDSANKKLSQFHTETLFSFPVACLMTWLCLMCVLIWGLAPAAAPTNRYTVASATVHENGQTQDNYTFVLDQQTGAMWLMETQPDKTVEFRKVKRLKLDGTPEVDDAATTAARP